MPLSDNVITEYRKDWPHMLEDELTGYGMSTNSQEEGRTPYTERMVMPRMDFESWDDVYRLDNELANQVVWACRKGDVTYDRTNYDKYIPPQPLPQPQIITSSVTPIAWGFAGGSFEVQNSFKIINFDPLNTYMIYAVVNGTDPGYVSLSVDDTGNITWSGTADFYGQTKVELTGTLMVYVSRPGWIGSNNMGLIRATGASYPVGVKATINKLRPFFINDPINLDWVVPDVNKSTLFRDTLDVIVSIEMRAFNSEATLKLPVLSATLDQTSITKLKEMDISQEVKDFISQYPITDFEFKVRAGWTSLSNEGDYMSPEMTYSDILARPNYDDVWFDRLDKPYHLDVSYSPYGVLPVVKTFRFKMKKYYPEAEYEVYLSRYQDPRVTFTQIDPVTHEFTMTYTITQVFEYFEIPEFRPAVKITFPGNPQTGAIGLESFYIFALPPTFDFLLPSPPFKMKKDAMTSIPITVRASDSPWFDVDIIGRINDDPREFIGISTWCDDDNHVVHASLPAFDKYPGLFKIGENKITFRSRAVLYSVKKFFWNITNKMPVPEWEREFTFIIEE